MICIEGSGLQRDGTRWPVGSGSPGRLAIAAIALLSAAPASAQWTAGLKKDEITDITSAGFYTTALSATVGSLDQPVRVALVFHCEKGAVTDLYFLVHAFVTSDNPVYLRFDGGAPMEMPAGASTDNTALFAGAPEEILDSILAHRRLVFRFTPYRGADQTTSFDLSGLTVHDGKMKQYCGFTASGRAGSLPEILASRTQHAAHAAEARAAAKKAAQLRSDSLIKEEAARRNRANAAADELDAAQKGSSDTTLTWVSGLMFDEYYRNTPGCRQKLAVHVAQLLFWGSEAGVKATGRRHTAAEGC